MTRRSIFLLMFSGTGKMAVIQYSGPHRGRYNLLNPRQLKGSSPSKETEKIAYHVFVECGTRVSQTTNKKGSESAQCAI